MAIKVIAEKDRAVLTLTQKQDECFDLKQKREEQEQCIKVLQVRISFVRLLASRIIMQI